MAEPIARRTGRRLACAVLAAAALALPGAGARAQGVARSNNLWRVVHRLCVPDRRLLGLPFPCSRVDLAAGYAVVPDPGGPLQVLVVPTRRVVGIEDPALLAPDAPNYWRDAWLSRDLLARRVGQPVPREALGMAVNAALGRSQEQLHIHLSCIAPDVAAQLAEAAGTLGPAWSDLPLRGKPWRARLVPGEELAAADDPFRLYAAAKPPEVDMADVTLVVAPVRLADGAGAFALLARTVDLPRGYTGHGEFLLDETCGAVRGSAPPGG